jgi:hypothetical protein
VSAPGGPKRLGGYELLSSLGHGAMGQVFLARDATGRRVALKVLLRSTDDPARLRREGELAARLFHPNLVNVLETGVDRGRTFLVSALVEDARSFGEVLQVADLRALVGLLRDAAAGLGYAHSQGVVHRDVKPENILVDASGVARVVDFGLAVSDTAERLTLSGALLGTPYYMAPEQLSGDRSRVGPWTDVWALGVILYQILMGELPFEGPSIVQLVSQIDEGAPPPSRGPRALRRICVRALNREPERRHADAAAFGRDLEGWLHGPVREGRRGPLAVAAALIVGAAVAAGLILSQPPPGAASPPPPATASPQPAGPAPAPTGAPTLVLQPGPLLGNDASVSERPWQEDDNRGLNLLHLSWVPHRPSGALHLTFPLLAFDLSRLPADAAIDEAVLELQVIGRQQELGEFVAVPLGEVDAPAWVEGTSMVDTGRRPRRPSTHEARSRSTSPTWCAAGASWAGDSGWLWPCSPSPSRRAPATCRRSCSPARRRPTPNAAPG